MQRITGLWGDRTGESWSGAVGRRMLLELSEESRIVVKYNRRRKSERDPELIVYLIQPAEGRGPDEVAEAEQLDPEEQERLTRLRRATEQLSFIHLSGSKWD